MVGQTTTSTSTSQVDNDDDFIIRRKIENTTEGLSKNCFKILYKRVLPASETNAMTICDYISSMRSETNPSDSYRKDVIILLSNFSIFHKGKSFKSCIEKNDILAFLNSHRKPEALDPLHKWIGTYNLYLTHLVRFFKWLYYPDIEHDKRLKPKVIENIAKVKRKETSIYKPTDLWTEEDDLLFLRYCPSKRMKCYHMVSRDTSCRPDEILKLRIKDIVFKIASACNNNQYAEVLVNGKTGTRHLPLVNSIPYVKDYLDYEHPFGSSNPNSIFICGTGKSLGRRIKVRSLHQIYEKYKNEHFPKLLESPNIPPEDKAKIKELLKKPWNPYIRRHSALTEKSTILKEHVLRQYAGWSGRSQMHLKYLHYFGNESSDSLLEAYGIITKDREAADVLKPKQCPNCNEPNKPDSKFCAKCRMVLTYDAYNETLENQKEKEDRLTIIESQIKALMSTLGNTKDQSQVNQMAKTLYDSKILDIPNHKKDDIKQ